MRHIVSFSGGKDSTALVLWARENLEYFKTVFCDTGWESEKTYKYIQHINNTILDNKLIVIKSEKYDGFEDMSIKKGRIASSQRRFCTQELKIFPMINYCNSIKDDKVVYQGIRKSESVARSKMKCTEYSEDYDALIERPLFHWSHKQIFDLHEKYNIEPNPLYKEGFSRVGCFPCVLCRHSELRQIAKKYPNVIDKMKILENNVGRSFFPPSYIPEQYHTGYDEKSKSTFPTVYDVVKYVYNENQIELFEETSCMSVYGLCE